MFQKKKAVFLWGTIQMQCKFKTNQTIAIIDTHMRTIGWSIHLQTRPDSYICLTAWFWEVWRNWWKPHTHTRTQSANVICSSYVLAVDGTKCIQHFSQHFDKLTDKIYICINFLPDFTSLSVFLLVSRTSSRCKACFISPSNISKTFSRRKRVMFI